jgi:hypothetical protein
MLVPPAIDSHTMIKSNMVASKSNQTDPANCPEYLSPFAFEMSFCLLVLVTAAE